MQYTDEQREQISIDYQRAVRNCNREGWSKMTSQEKVEDLQKIENYHAMSQNRLASDVSFEDMEEGLHGYQTGNSIVISKADLEKNDYQECVDTVFHESQHGYFRQGQWFTEVRQQLEQEYTAEQIREIESPIPDAKVDYQGYYNHLNEAEARAAGTEGVRQLESDHQVISGMDGQRTAQNQILETYDYDALSMATEQQTEMSSSWEGVSVYDLQDGSWVPASGHESGSSISTERNGTAEISEDTNCSYSESEMDEPSDSASASSYSDTEMSMGD